MNAVEDFEERLKGAVRQFWTVRASQASQQGSIGVAKERGGRGAVTGGKQMDGFVRLLHDVLVEAGISSSMIFCSTRSGEDDVGEQPKPKKKRRERADGPIVDPGIWTTS